MNIRPDTPLYQVLSELLGQAGRAKSPAAPEAAKPVAAPAKKATAAAPQPAATATASTGPAATSSAPPPIKPRGSIVNIVV